MNVRDRERNNGARGLRRSLAERRDLVEQFKGSGLSQAAFSRQEGIHPVTLSRWLKQGPPSIRFAEVVLPALRGPEIEISLPNGAVVRIRDAAASEQLGELVRRVVRC